MGAEVSVYTEGLCVLCSEQCCHSAVCKLCCIRKGDWMGLSNMGIMLNCK